MSPCCIAAATAAAVMTALIVIVLSAFVLAADGFGIGVLLCTTLALALQQLQLIGPCPRLLYGFSALLAVRAAWLMTTTRRSLAFAVWRFVRPKASWAVLHLTPVGWVQRTRSHRCPRTEHATDATALYRIGPGPR